MFKKEITQETYKHKDDHHPPGRSFSREYIVLSEAANNYAKNYKFIM